MALVILAPPGLGSSAAVFYLVLLLIGPVLALVAAPTVLRNRTKVTTYLLCAIVPMFVVTGVCKYVWWAIECWWL